MASSRSISREDEEEYLDRFENGYTEPSQMGSYNSEDDEHFSGYSQIGGKQSAIPQISHHAYETDLVEVNNEKCGAPCYLTLTNGDCVDCICAKYKHSCSRHRRKKFERCPNGHYQKAPVKTKASQPTGLLKASCAAHKSDPNTVIVGYTSHEGKRAIAMTQDDANRYEAEGWVNPFPFESPSEACYWPRPAFVPTNKGKNPSSLVITILDRDLLPE